MARITAMTVLGTIDPHFNDHNQRVRFQHSISTNEMLVQAARDAALVERLHTLTANRRWTPTRQELVALLQEYA